MRHATLLVLIFAAIAALPARATVQPLEAVSGAAESFVRTRLPESKAKHFVTASQLDPRLRLEACAVPLETFTQTSTPTGERVTVGVRCTAAPWTLYVPVTVEVEIPVLVLRRALARRSRVELSDVEPQVRRLPGSAAHFIEDVARLQGHRLKRSLAVGTALTVDMLAPDVLVRRGQQVTLLAAKGPVEIRARGQALSEGGVADRIRVQNLSSLKVVEGVIESSGIVRIGL